MIEPRESSALLKRIFDFARNSHSKQEKINNRSTNIKDENNCP